MVQRVMGHERSSTTLNLYTRRTDDPTRVLRALDDEEDGDDGGSHPLAEASRQTPRGHRKCLAYLVPGRTPTLTEPTSAPLDAVVRQLDALD
jgi:hypothetical protein